MNIRKGRKALRLWIIIMIFCTACGKTEGKEVDQKKMGKPDYVICKEWELPDELAEIIEQKKEEKFHFTYEDSAYLYLAAGYGRQSSKEYMAVVEEVYETDKELVIDFILVSIYHAGEQKGGEPSDCPYLVLRTEKTKKAVLFP